MKFKTKAIWFPSSESGVRHGTIMDDRTYILEGEYIQYTLKETFDKFNLKWNVKSWNTIHITMIVKTDCLKI